MKVLLCALVCLSTIAITPSAHADTAPSSRMLFKCTNSSGYPTLYVKVLFVSADAALKIIDWTNVQQFNSDQECAAAKDALAR